MAIRIRITIVILTLQILIPRLVQAETIQYRIDNGLSALQYDQELTDFAYSRQYELCSGDWSHSGFINRYNQLSDNYLYMGENLGSGYGGDDSKVFEAWIASPTHFNNIVYQYWSNIGKAKFSCNGEVYWVEIFGQHKPVYKEIPSEVTDNQNVTDNQEAITTSTPELKELGRDIDFPTKTTFLTDINPSKVYVKPIIVDFCYKNDYFIAPKSTQRTNIFKLLKAKLMLITNQ